MNVDSSFETTGFSDEQLLSPPHFESMNTSFPNYSEPLYLNITQETPLEYAIPLYGYGFPILFIITVVANTLIMVVLSKRHMRSPTNAVLMAMALADMLTVLFPAPWFLYLYTFGNHYKPFYPLVACYSYLWMHEVLPNLFHTASIWLTLALAIQRYIYVCHAATARTWCTMPRVLKVIGWIFLLATIHQSSRFVDRVYSPMNITWEEENYTVCQEEFAPWMREIANYYFSSYFLFRIAFVHLLPCGALIVLNLLLLRAMREAQRKRQQLFKDNKKGSGECRKLMDSYSTTLMLFVVVSVFLIVEVPLAVLSLLHIISSVADDEFLDYKLVNMLILFSNFLITMSYPINFGIYCGMSRQFRKTFKELFVWGGGTNKEAYGSSRYSLVNGPRTCTNETVL